MINRPSAWDGYFDTTYLYNCNVVVYTCSSSLTSQFTLFDKTAIASYSYRGRGSFILATFPTETVEIELLDWDRFTATKKAYIKTNNAIAVYYVVNGSMTSNRKVFVISDVQIDNRKNRAKIVAKSIFEMLFNDRYNPQVMYGVVNQNNVITPATYNYLSIRDISNNILSGFSFYGSYNSSLLTNNFNVKQIPVNISKAEALQNVAVVSATSFRLSNGVFSFAQYDNLDSSTIKEFKVKNVFGDYEIKEEKSDLDTLLVVGYTTTQIAPSNGSTYEARYGYEEANNTFFSKLYVNVGYSAVNLVYDKNKLIYFDGIDSDNGDVMIQANYTLQNNKLVITTSYTSQTVGRRWQINVSCYEMSLDYPTNASTYIASPFFHAGKDTYPIATVQSKARNYFKYKTFIEYKCRIDPSIEPLDYLRTDKYEYWVEEVDINFNGGFTGRIKGRINTGLSNFIKDPVVSSRNLVSWNDYSIVISNPNAFPVNMTLICSAGREEYYIGSNSALTLTYQNASIISNSVGDYIDQDADLSADVYCFFESDDADPIRSRSTIILEAE